MKRLVLIFPQLQPVHLLKDVGKVPEKLAQLGSFECEIWGGTHPEMCSVEEPPVELRPIEGSGRVSRYVNLVLRLFREAKSIHCLTLFHFKIETLLLALFFRVMNPSGLVFVKSDANISIRELLKSPLKRFAIWAIVRLARCVSFETSRVFQLFCDEFPKLQSRFVLLPNGIDENELSSSTSTRKENMMITAGRLGLKTKGTLKLLSLLFKIRSRLEGWNVLFVGSYDEVHEDVEQFFNNHPEMRDFIQFTGHISSRKELFEMYQKSKIYLVPSETESFGIAMQEAANFGNVLVGYDVGGMMDMTDNSRFGKVVPVGDEEALAEAILFYLDSEEQLLTDIDSTMRFVKEHFSWTKSIPELIEHLNP